MEVQSHSLECKVETHLAIWKLVFKNHFYVVPEIQGTTQDVAREKSRCAAKLVCFFLLF